MAKFTPKFSVPGRVETKFSTNNPTGRDRESDVVQIVDLFFNQNTRSIEATGSDGRKRNCRIDRFSSDKDLKELSKNLQDAYNKELGVVFVAAGGNDPNVWFYNIIIID